LLLAQLLIGLDWDRRWNPLITAAVGTFGPGERLDLTNSPPARELSSMMNEALAHEANRLGSHRHDPVD
jgi:hypothetical protein